MMRRNDVADFFEAFNNSYELAKKVGKSYEIAKASREKPEDAEVAQPGMLGPQPEGQDYPTQKGQKFLGKTYDTPLNEQQISDARAQAMAGIYDKYGDAETASRMRSNITQSKLANAQLSQAESQGRQTKRSEDMQAKADEVRQKVGDYAQQFTTGPDGQPRQLTVDDHLHLGQYQASELMKAGMTDDASKLASQNMQFTAHKIQTETAVRDQALGLATAAAAQGDFSGIKNFYNKFVPDGAQTTGIVANKDGSISVSRVGIDGDPLPGHTFKDIREMLAATQSISKPEALVNYANNEFSQNMQRKQLGLQQQGVNMQGEQLKMAKDERSRQNTERDAGKAASVGLYGEVHPDATPVQLEAVKAGIIPAVTGKGAYKVEAGDVTTLLGNPAIDEKGKPITDPLTGKQMVNRDPAKEQAFFQWMKKNGINDTNAGLAQYLGQQAQAAPGAPVQINSPAERDKLPSGTVYMSPDGTLRTKK